MSYIKNKIKLDSILVFLFSIFPLSILSGNFSININIILISSLFIFLLLRNKDDFFKHKENLYIFYLLIFFFLSLIVNLIFSNNFFLSYQRVLKIFFIIFFILAFKFLIMNHHQDLQKIYKLWIIIFLIVIFDLMIEFYLGKNIFSQSSKMPGRLGSFTGEESVIGNFFFGFCLIFLSYIHNKSQKNTLNISLAFFLIIVSFFIGERANFIKTFSAIMLFIFLTYKINYKVKFLSSIFAIILIYFLFLNVNSDYKQRYFNQIHKIFKQDGLNYYLENSQYGAHRNVAKEIFLDNPIFGVGIKNFRIESGNEKYNDLDHKLNHLRVSNHPHELYYEFLSETGIFGLSCFLIFILTSIIISFKSYMQKKNIYQLSALIIVVLSILPIIPTGSFLSTYMSSIFWINYAIMIGYCGLKKTRY